MKEDVVELIKIRNELSKDLGYKDYPDITLKTEEININDLLILLNKYVNDNLLKVQNLINKYSIKWDNWLTDLKKFHLPLLDIKLDVIFNELLKRLGYENVKEKIKITYIDHGFSGITSKVSENVIRIVVAPIKTLFNLNCFFHEIGHAITYSLNSEKGIYRILPSSYDEAMAVVFEYIAPMIMFDSITQKKLSEIRTLEYTRCAISSLFEFELWNKPDIAERLYIKHYSKLGFNIVNPEDWASDTFRSIDPVYIQNYVIGAVLAEKIIDFLKKEYSDNYLEWGNWLLNQMYFDGRKRPLFEKIKDLILY